MTSTATSAISPLHLAVASSKRQLHQFHHPFLINVPRKHISVSCFVKFPVMEQFNNPAKVKVLLSNSKKKLWNVMPDAVKCFPWKKAETVALEKVLVSGKHIFKWCLLGCFAFSSISDIVYSVSRNKELVIPLGLFVGITTTKFFDEISRQVMPDHQDGRINWRLLSIASVFVFVKVTSTFFPGLSHFFVHAANGGLMQVVWNWNEIHKLEGEKSSSDAILNPINIAQPGKPISRAYHLFLALCKSSSISRFHPQFPITKQTTMAEIPNQVLKRRRPPPYRYSYITWYMDALVDRPEILTAIGGIPDELKIKDCILFRRNPSIKVLRLVINKILSENDDGQPPVGVSSGLKLHPIMYTDKLSSLGYLLNDVNRVLKEEEEEEEEEDQDQPHNMTNIDQQLDVAANLVDDPATAERGVKRRCCTSFHSVATPHGINHILKCDGGDDHPYQSIQCIKGVMFNQPGIVGAIGGIPDELKSKDGVSFWVPHPTLKVPKDLPEDPTEYDKAFSGAIAKSYVEDDFVNNVNLAYHKALRDSSTSSIAKQEPYNMTEVISKQLEEEPKSVIDHQLPHSMLEVNIASNFGIPYELKIKDGISFSFPFPSFKVPKNLPTDPTLRDKIMAKVFKNAGDEFEVEKLFLQAYKKALGTSSQSEKEEKGKEKTHNIDQGPSTLVEVNLAGPIENFPYHKFFEINMERVGT